MANTQAHISRLKARLEVLEAKAKVTERKQRTRRLILLGTVVEEFMAVDVSLANRVRERADQKFQRKIDRQALNLPPLESSSSPDPTLPI